MKFNLNPCGGKRFLKFIQMEKRYISKDKIIKLLKELGHSEIELTYRKDEGWWLCSNKFDDWLAMNSYGCWLRIKREFKTS